MPRITVEPSFMSRSSARLDEMKLHVGVLLVLLTQVMNAMNNKEHLDMILLDHMFEMLGDMEGECDSLSDEFRLEDTPF